VTTPVWTDLETLFHESLARHPEERAAFLAARCAGRPDLRAQLDAMLRAHEEAGSATAVLAYGAPLMKGARLGAYEIRAPLGAGGMGEVYRARDIRLGREVAIKILPAEFASHPDRLARFEREARMLAALNHPHIATIHGVEESAGIRALVLELVEGDTLAERIARRNGSGLVMNEALEIASQIADALDAAHEHGIVHRDLKPANIKITRDNLVKVLDFGLAKLDPHHDGNDTQSPTITIDGTAEGVILGTAAYMSPEQARGERVDKRADIWAFGCVLYEMLTGCNAFSRRTVSDTVAAILEREPDYTALPISLPATARRLLQRCLVKDSRQRLRDIGDARQDIRAALDELSSGSGRAVDTRDRPRRLPKALVAGTVMLTAAVALWARWPLRSPVDMNLTRGTLERLTYDAGVTRMPQFSPDGRLLAFASDRAGQNNLDIWVQQVNGGAPLRLTDDAADDTAPRFSPDGSQIVFRSDRGGGGVYMVPALGGVARLIAPGGRGPRFSPDGTRISYWTGDFRGSPSAPGGSSAAFVVPLAGGTPMRLLSDFVIARDPVWSPDGQSVLMLGRRDRTSPIADAFDWWWVPLHGGSPMKTGVLDLPGLRAAEPAPGDWTASGVLFSDGNNIQSIPISESTGTIAGELRQLTFGTGQYADPTIARDGTIAFAALTLERAIERVPLGEHQPKNVERLHSDGQPVPLRASSTRDGSVIAFERNIQTHWEIWLKNLRTGQQVMLLRVEAPSLLNATISDDGARVAYTVADAQGSITGRGFVVETSGGLPKNVCAGCALHGFLSDNRRVLAEVTDRRTIRLYDIASGSYQTLLATADGALDRPHASPDDRWIAFRQSGKTSVTRLSPEQPPAQHTWARVDEPTTTGRPMGWSPNSELAYLLLDTDGFRCVYAQRIDTASGALRGSPYAVLHFHGNETAAAGVSTSYGNAVSAAGFVYEAINTKSDIWKLTAASTTRP
jgi:serine/threonine protein kinase/Tol biopolymer transport system component